MAIKSSNQITFTEHKKIIEIKEWYLATSKNSGVTTSTDGWTTNIQTINYNNKYLWNYEEVIYSIGSSDISDPVIIGTYGDTGSSLQIKYLSSSTPPVIYNNDVSEWSDTIPEVKDGEHIYMTQKLSSDDDWSTPIQISAQDGEMGVGISEIKNYYITTTDVSLPDSPQWDVIVPLLSPENKYLWNYEEIIYTNGLTHSTDPAIIGVYGDSGASVVTFEIYSTHGFIFKENLKVIELKTVAFYGDETITDATYSWEWWNDTLNNGEGGYSTIDNSNSVLEVNEGDEYAFASIKCTMTYEGKTYEDYVTLSSETVIYTSTVKFFDGSNIFRAGDLYIVAYIELYQNNHKIETIAADSYCTGISKVNSSGVITSSIAGNFTNGDRMYFVCKNENLYDVILGQYTDGTWNEVEAEIQYEYANSLYPSLKSNVIAISKESINKSQNIDFAILKDGICVSNTYINIIDSNDPIIDNEPPSNPVYGQLWLDTSMSPHILKIYTQTDNNGGGRWEECMEKIGGAIFTSKPTSYRVGDLWILSNGEFCGDFGPGSMLKAIVSATTDEIIPSHWIDADRESTELKENIKQYFNFDSSTGLRIGQSDDKFYVNINSTEMGFYDNKEGQHQQVVKISNSSAIILSAKLKGNTEFYGQINICDPTADPDDSIDDTLFIWKIEKNGSLSLAYAK